ncbi:MAG: UbiA-like polyprenyltransferase [Dissulfurispiraceae bacterium]|jgi:4-hydroxybenzoate polyprenyltransferase
MTMKTLAEKTVLYLRMIKISHSVFALPFAFVGALLAARGMPAFHDIFWIAVAMVGARSGAMGLNRIIDRKIDAHNPRTSNREIPSGKIKVRDALFFTAVSLGVMVLAAYQLNRLCLMLSPLAIAILVLYSYTKRFTWSSHFVLGLAIAGAPLGAWIAIRGSLNIEIVPLAVAVILWLAGFDILYALQDIDFDKQQGLFSIPRRFGIRKSLIISRVLHSFTFGLFIVTGIIFSLNAWYFIGLVIVGIFLTYEHSLVKPNDMSKLNMAFFNMNGYISITILIFTLISVVSS